jgi:hypothetical protein
MKGNKGKHRTRSATRSQTPAVTTPATDDAGNTTPPAAGSLADQITAAVAAAVAPLHQAIADLQGVAGDDVDDDGGEDPAGTPQAARQAFIAEHMGDLPAAYQKRLPLANGGDVDALKNAEQRIRRQYRADLAAAAAANPHPTLKARMAAGVGPGDVGGAVDWSKLSPVQQIEVGLSMSRNAAAGGPADAA